MRPPIHFQARPLFRSSCEVSPVGPRSTGVKTQVVADSLQKFVDGLDGFQCDFRTISQRDGHVEAQRHAGSCLNDVRKRFDQILQSSGFQPRRESAAACGRLRTPDRRTPPRLPIQRRVASTQPRPPRQARTATARCRAPSHLLFLSHRRWRGAPPSTDAFLFRASTEPPKEPRRSSAPPFRHRAMHPSSVDRRPAASLEDATVPPDQAVQTATIPPECSPDRSRTRGGRLERFPKPPSLSPAAGSSGLRQSPRSPRAELSQCGHLKIRLDFGEGRDSAIPEARQDFRLQDAGGEFREHGLAGQKTVREPAP